MNNLNELTSEGSSSFHYDANGNLTNRPSITNFYDGENRLIAVTTVSNFGLTHIPIETSFVYDGLGRLREQGWWTNSSGGGGGGSSPPPTGGSGWTLVGGIAYIYDGNRVIQERDLNDNPLVSYTRGNDLSGSLQGAGGIGGLLARSDGYSSGTFTEHDFYHADGNGNITYLVNSSQTLAASYRYDPFGNLISSSGSLATTNTYRFSSKELIPSVSLYYYLYRFYDPGLQRWLTRDPIMERGGIRLYLFAGNSPIDRADFLGLAASSMVETDKRLCDIAKSNGMDQDNSGGVICLNGKQIPCAWKPGKYAGLKNAKAKSITEQCVLEHENAHISNGDAVCPTCPGVLSRAQPKDPSDRAIAAAECNAYKAQDDCLEKAFKSDACGNDNSCWADLTSEMNAVEESLGEACGGTVPKAH